MQSRETKTLNNIRNNTDRLFATLEHKVTAFYLLLTHAHFNPKIWPINFSPCRIREIGKGNDLDDFSDNVGACANDARHKIVWYIFQ